MTDREQYTPGPASGAQVRKDGEKWTLILVRELRHSPEKVWQALTDPAHLREWAPFEADGSLGTVGTTVKLTTVGAPTPQVSETRVTRADAPRVLEYNWGGNDIRWELEAFGGGTRLTLWHDIDRRFISMGAAGWHICFDVLDHLLSGDSHRPHRWWRGDEVRLASAQFGVCTAIRYRRSELATRSRTILRLPAMVLSSAVSCLWKSFRQSRTPFRDRPETVRLHPGTACQPCPTFPNAGQTLYNPSQFLGWISRKQIAVWTI